MRTLWLSLLFTAGCTDGWWTQDDTQETGDTFPVDDGCPEDMDPAVVGTVTFSQFIFDGVTLNVGFNNSLRYNGAPVACVGPTAVQFLSYLNDEPFAWFYIEPERTGSFNVGGTGVVTVIDVIGGNTPTLFANSDFTGGTFTVYDVGNRHTGQITNGSAVNNLHNIALSISYEFQP